MADHDSLLNAALEGRYRVERLLGEGGMATVYLATDVRHDRPVALKAFRPEVAETLGEKRFLREIEIAARLSHPRIVPVLDSGTIDGRLFYVMTYYRGESLRERLGREGQLPVPDAIEITRQVATGLSFAHAHGVVHRDVKPGNILLVGGDAVVTDFGIARAVTEAGGTRLTESGVVVGTPVYMSPEQASGDRDPGPRGDIYALGCVLYEMLAGEPPFTGRTAQAVTARKLSQSAPDVSIVREAVPEAIVEILARALAPVPADRYSTADELEGDLRRVATRPVRAEGRVKELRRTGGPPDLRKRLVGGSILVAILAMAIWGWVRSPGAEPSEPVRAPISLPPGVDVTRDVAAGRAVAVSPDGRTVVVVGTDDTGRRLYRRPSDRLEATPIDGTDGAGSPFFSPDGRWLGFFAEGGLHRVPVEGGTPVEIATVPDVPMGAAWGLGDRIVFSSGYRSPLYVVSAEGGAPAQLTTLDAERGELSHRHPAILPGGRTLLFTAFGSGLGTWRFDLEEGERVGEITEGIAPRYADGHLLVGRDATVFGAPFDAREATLRGPLVPLVEGVTSELGIAALHYDVSDGGTLVYVPGSERGGLEIVFPEDSVQTLPDRGLSSRPRFSPRGRRLAVRAGGDIWIYDLDADESPSRLTFDGGEAPIWTPDGTAITYGVQGEGLFVRPVDEPGERERILELEVWAQPVGWTPDREILAFAMERPEWDLPDEEIACLAALADGEHECIVDVGGWWARLSPDGRWLAYQSRETGADEVYVTDFPDGASRWQISQEGGSTPAWGPDGLELYFRAGSRLVAARIDTTAGVRVRSRRVALDPFRVLRPDDYDIHPDGRTVALVRPLEGPQQGDLIAVFDWLPELRRRMRQ